MSPSSSLAAAVQQGRLGSCSSAQQCSSSSRRPQQQQAARPSPLPAASWRCSRRLKSHSPMVVCSSSGGGTSSNGSGTATALAAAGPRTATALAALLGGGARCPYPTLPAGQRMLEAALPDIVRNLSRAPFVLVSSGSKRDVVTVPHSVAAASHQEVWHDVAPSLEARRPDMYVFVQEVPQDAFTKPAAGTAAATSAAEDAAAAAAAVKQCLERQPMAGRLGDCCDGEGGEAADHSHHASSSSSSTSVEQQQQQERAAPRLPTPRKGCLETRKAWGLVVRTHDADHPVAGCYLLTTVQNSDPTGCTCVHFSATRVCQGESLYNQLVRSWLVTA